MIVLANLLSATLDDLTREIGNALTSESDCEVETVDAVVEDFRHGRAGVALICGLAYTLLHDAIPGRFIPVAAPIINDSRVADAPVYFSDIVVAADHSATTFQQLKGARFAYNEEVSFSGYRALEYSLKAEGSSWDFFEQRVRTGSHARSLAIVTGGDADAAAIDSHALLLETQRNPLLATKLKVVASLGPFPAPPIVINSSACFLTEDRLREALSRLPQERLTQAAIRNWHPVDDAYYDRIRSVTADMRLEL